MDFLERLKIDHYSKKKFKGQSCFSGTEAHLRPDDCPSTSSRALQVRWSREASFQLNQKRKKQNPKQKQKQLTAGI